VTIQFKNDDPGVPHNVEIKDGSGAEVFKGEIITGPAEASYAVPPLKAGSYTFACTVHPNMTGTLTVQ
jgi:plastocyanin